jgi:hypothetical protein
MFFFFPGRLVVAQEGEQAAPAKFGAGGLHEKGAPATGTDD